jgi:pimeloyl-ACP methyl ester carboxylesterase
MTKIFIHGLDSSNQGAKALFFKSAFPDMIIPNFPGALQERMDRLNGILSKKTGIRLVGSSFGGLMATMFAMENESKVDRLVLLAPALNLMGFSKPYGGEISVPTWVYHGKDDEVIPFEAMERVARKTFRHLTLHAVDDDHHLQKTFNNIDWRKHLIPS